MRSDSGTGRGFSRTLWTTENRAVFAPMQSARVSAAVSVNALSRHRSRRPTRRSEIIRPVDVRRQTEVHLVRLERQTPSPFADDVLPPGYSDSATIGSMRVARRAGSAQAPTATTARSVVTEASTIGSAAL